MFARSPGGLKVCCVCLSPTVACLQDLALKSEMAGFIVAVLSLLCVYPIGTLSKEAA